jgi:hypothetical protein
VAFVVWGWIYSRHIVSDKSFAPWLIAGGVAYGVTAALAYGIDWVCAWRCRPKSSLLPMSNAERANHDPQQLADRPSTQARKPVSTLPPQMSAVLFWPVFANVARALFSNSLVVGEPAQDALERPLVHASRLDRHGTVSAPLEPSA